MRALICDVYHQYENDIIEPSNSAILIVGVVVIVVVVGLVVVIIKKGFCICDFVGFFWQVGSLKKRLLAY